MPPAITRTGDAAVGQRCPRIEARRRRALSCAAQSKSEVAMRIVHGLLLAALSRGAGIGAERRHRLAQRQDRHARGGRHGRRRSRSPTARSSRPAKSDEIVRLAGPATRRIDLGGRTVIPGLIDSHMHAIRAALFYATEVNWIGAQVDPGGDGAHPRRRRRRRSPANGSSWRAAGRRRSSPRSAARRRPSWSPPRRTTRSTSSCSIPACC